MIASQKKYFSRLLNDLSSPHMANEMEKREDKKISKCRQEKICNVRLTSHTKADTQFLHTILRKEDKKNFLSKYCSCVTKSF